MCGIAGALSMNGSRFRVDTTLLNRMRDTMVHRGPDGCGTWLSDDGSVGLAHRRLSIIDLSDSASQPMCNEDGTLWVSYNGEIYNHAQIRRDLEASGGHTWKTDHSDTEVIVHAFEEWGIDCIERFNGMFAIAIWDVRAKELWLIRDRIGIKPLYYSVSRDSVLFASEIKALLAAPSQERAVNGPALFDFLSFMAVPAPNTLFKGIHKLPGGTWLRVSYKGDIRTHRYWDALTNVEPMEGRSEDDIAEELLFRLRDSVRARRESDVPVGVFLSGGIDSSTNVALFSEDTAEPLKTFSIGYQGAYESYQNELHYAKLVADKFSAEYHERLLDLNDLTSFLPRMVALQDEPIADPVCIPVYYVAKTAKENGVTVCQVGEGADELFVGYKYWQLADRLQRLDDLPVPRSAKRLGLRFLSAMGRRDAFDYEWLRRGSAGTPVFWGGAEAYTQERKLQLIGNDLRKTLPEGGSWASIEPIYKRFLESAWDRSPLNWMTYLDLNNRLPELLLMRIDKMTMAASVEARVPFLDHEFVEFSLGIPSRLKTKGRVGKYILRKAVRNTIPSTVIDRRKQGFAIPIHDWFHGEFGHFAREKLERFCKNTGLLNFAPIESMLTEHKASAAWPLLNLALWWETYIDQ